MPDIRQRVTADGRVRYLLRYRIDGERKALTYDTEAEALDAYVGLMARARGSSGHTLRSWGRRCMKERSADPSLRAVKRYDGSIWARHIEAAPFIDWPLRRIQRVHVHRWAKALAKTPACTVKHSPRTGETTVTETDRPIARKTALNALRLLSVYLSAAADEGLLAANPALGVRIPKRPTSEDSWTFLSLDEIERVLALPSLRPSQRAAFTLGIYTGLRAGELWGLRWADVVTDGDRPMVRVRHSYDGPTKSGRVRDVPLLEPARDALVAYRDIKPGIGQALVFPGRDGRCHASGYDAQWPAVAELADLHRCPRLGKLRRPRFHELRHSNASHLVMGSWGRAWSLREVQQMLGHQSITTTERYAHLAPEALHAAASKTIARDHGGIT